MLNKMVEEYLLLESIGEGQYGSVYRAKNQKDKQQYAVKVMANEKFKQTPKLNELTNNEISILSKLDHPNIIKFIQILRTQNNVYLVYQYCNGGNLSQLIKLKGRLTPLEAEHIFAQLQSGFQALFREKILHRDFKPANVLFHDGVVKIADFGFCKQMLMEKQMSHTMIGSPIYMAPQVLKGLDYDNRADIWSLGVILYEMLYGVCPFEENSIHKLVSVIQKNLIVFNPEIAVPAHLRELMQKMLMIRFRDRMSSSQFVKYPLGSKQNAYKPSSPQKRVQTTSRDVLRYVRRAITYLADSLLVLANHVEQLSMLRCCFMVYKMLGVFHRETKRASPYWACLRLENHQDKWDFILQSEMKLAALYGDLAKEALRKTDPSAKEELQTNYIGTRCFIDQVKTASDPTLKERLLNCLLYYRHFIYVLQKKSPDFTDYTVSNKSLAEKEDICLKFAKVCET